MWPPSAIREGGKHLQWPHQEALRAQMTPHAPAAWSFATERGWRRSTAHVLLNHNKYNVKKQSWTHHYVTAVCVAMCLWTACFCEVNEIILAGNQNVQCQITPKIYDPVLDFNSYSECSQVLSALPVAQRTFQTRPSGWLFLTSYFPLHPAGRKQREWCPEPSEKPNTQF